MQVPLEYPDTNTLWYVLWVLCLEALNTVSLSLKPSHFIGYVSELIILNFPKHVVDFYINLGLLLFLYKVFEFHFKNTLFYCTLQFSGTPMFLNMREGMGYHRKVKGLVLDMSTDSSFTLMGRKAASVHMDADRCCLRKQSSNCFVSLNGKKAKSKLTL